MENASKALIIAGAILLAILIIGLGIYIYNQAQNSVSETGMDKMQVRQFNGQFQPYLDVTLSSNTAKALIDTARNAGLELTGVTSKTNIKSNKEYEAIATYKNDDETNVITSIHLQVKGSGSQSHVGGGGLGNSDQTAPGAGSGIDDLKPD